MIGLDTNVVIRYIVFDDPVQTPKAEKLIDSLSPQNQAFISLVVVAEIAWVLKASYRYKRLEIASVMRRLLASQEIVLEQRELVADALRRFSEGGADLPDYLIERCGNVVGCTHTFTFDETAANVAGMRLLK